LSITWRPSGLACWERRASRPKKFEEAQQYEAALFRAVVVDVVVHSLREIGQLLEPQSPLQRPDIIRRVETASAATPGLSATRTASLPSEVSVPVPAPNRRALHRGCCP